MQFCIVLAVLSSFIVASVVTAGGTTTDGTTNDVSLMVPKLIAVVLCQWLVVMTARAISWQTRADCSSGLMSSATAIRRLESRYRLHTCVWIIVVVATLVCFDWIRLVEFMWTSFASTIHLPVLARVPLVIPLAGLVPIIGSLVLSWACFYDAEIVVDRNAQRQSRMQFVTKLVRLHLVPPVVPVALIVGWCQSVELLFPAAMEFTWASIVHIVPLFSVAAAFPVLLNRTWGTRRLVAGKLREKLERRLESRGIEVRDILIWETGGTALNAAMTGFVPQFRYLLLTDGLVDRLRFGELEMVLEHEISHASRRHSLKLLAAIGLLMASGSALIMTLQYAAAERGGDFVALNQFGVLSATLAATLICGGVLVGKLARLFEIQADLDACFHCGCFATAPNDGIAGCDDYLLVIGKLAGGPGARATWLHPSHQQRCEFLSKGLEEATASLRYRQRVVWLNIAGWALVAGGVAMVW